MSREVQMVSMTCLSSRSAIGRRSWKRRLVDEFNELTHKDMDEASDDPDEIVDRIQKKTGQPRDLVERRVTEVMRRG
jgi:hypothetical protein